MNGASKNNSVQPSKAKKAKRFNIVDLLLILIAIMLVFVLVYVFSPVSWVRSLIYNQQKTIEYTIEIRNVDEAFLDSIKENDVVIDSVTKNTIGKVSKIDDEKPNYSELQLVQTPGKDDDGNDILSNKGALVEYPDKYNIVITVAATADYAVGKGYSVNSTDIRVGEQLSLNFPNFTCVGYCIGIK